MEEDPSPVDLDMIIKLIPKLEYRAVLEGLEQLRPLCEKQGMEALPVLPATLPDDLHNHATLIDDLHRVLFNIHVTDGSLVCPATKRVFPIKDGIPNMILHEDEI